MSDDFQKLWLQQNLNQHAINRAQQEIQRTGRALPCRVTEVSGSIVTVTFEVQGGPWTLPPITIPKAESQWLRAPTQVGDYGMTMPADTSLAAISGMGTAVADLTVTYGNLATLVFVPVAAEGFSAPPDPDKAWVNGPKGAVVSAADGTASVDCDQASGEVRLSGATGTSGEAVVTVSQLQTALDNYRQAEITAGVTNASAIVVPTATGSSKTFSG